MAAPMLFQLPNKTKHLTVPRVSVGVVYTGFRMFPSQTKSCIATYSKTSKIPAWLLKIGGWAGGRAAAELQSGQEQGRSKRYG